MKTKQFNGKAIYNPAGNGSGIGEVAEYKTSLELQILKIR